LGIQQASPDGLFFDEEEREGYPSDEKRSTPSKG